VVSLEPPHPPYQAAASGISFPTPETLVLRPNVPDGAAAQARRELAGYYAHIEATDRAIGRLLTRIDLATTAIVITSAHGDMHGSQGLFRKGWPFEESVRVPLLISAPEWPAQVSDAAVSLVDLPALTLSFAAGKSSLPSMEEAHISMPSVVRLPHQGDRKWTGLRSATRKIVLNADGTPWHFFDLSLDPWESNNLVEDPARAAEIAQWTKRVK
jgi:arylsulfatase A-like enzyme